MSKISHRTKDLKSVGGHESFMRRIQKTLYYGKLPATDRLSLPVTEMATEIFSEPRQGKSIERLHCKDAAYISRQACISPCSFVLAVMYLERLKTCNPDYLQSIAPSELFLVSLMISGKFLHDNGDDDEVFLDEWAISGGMSVQELIKLERQFLNAIEWNVFVSDAHFWKHFLLLEARIAKKQGIDRGYFTYTELTNLVSTIETKYFVQYLVKLMAVLLATYAAGILTIISSMFIASQLPGNCLMAPQIDIRKESTNTTSQSLYTETLISDVDIETDQIHKKYLDAAYVLKTGIILASIKPSAPRNKNFTFFNEENTENITWDWWTSSTMQWLSKTSEIIETLNVIPSVTKLSYNHFIDMKIACTKKFELEDQLHKATKIRIQDLLEQNWHTEWTDTLASLVLKPFLYLQKSYIFV